MLIYTGNHSPQVSGNAVGMHSPSNAKDHHGHDRDGKGDYGGVIAVGNPKESIYPGDWKEQDDTEY